MERFWTKVNKTPTCWLWTAATSKGYGKFGMRHGVVRSAHRLAWEMEVGPIPEGLMVLHHCDVPACVRPDHLYLGTAADNWRDTLARSRRPPTYNNGETNAAAKLTSRDVADIRSRLTAGESVRSIARTYPVGRTMIQHIKHGRAWANDPSATVAS